MLHRTLEILASCLADNFDMMAKLPLNISSKKTADKLFNPLLIVL